MKHSARVQLRHVLFTQWMETSLNISHPEGSGLLHVLLIHMSVSLLSMGKSKTQQLLLNCYFPVWCCPDARLLWPLWSVNTQRAQHQSTFAFKAFLMSIHVYIFIFYEHSLCQIYLARANWLFPHQVKCNGNFRECTCTLNVCFDENVPELGDPWKLLGENKSKAFDFFLFPISIQMVVLENC